MPAAEPPLPPRPPGPTDVFAAPLPPFPAMIVSMELNETEAAGAALTKTPRATPPSRPFDPEVGPPEPARARTPLIVLLIMFAVAPYQTELPAANVELALNCTPPQAPTPTPVLFAPNVISPPELPSARKVPRTYRWTLGSARTVVPGRIVSVAPRFTVTLPYMTQMQNVSQLAVPMGPDR